MIEYHFPLVQTILEVGFEFLEKNEKKRWKISKGGERRMDWYLETWNVVQTAQLVP